MVHKKVARKAQALRNELYGNVVIEAAEAEFAAHGFVEARMQRVADRAGLSVGTVYNLFDGKDALYAAIHKQRRAALAEQLQGVLSADGPVFARVGQAIHAHVAFCAAHPNYLRIQLRRGNAWSTAVGHQASSDLREFKRGVQLAAALFARGIRRNELVSEQPERMVLTLIAVYQAHMQSWLDAGMREPARKVAERVLALFGRMYVR